VLFGRKQYEAAVDQCRRALRASPKHYAARNLLGATYVALERWPEAITALEPLLKEPTYTTPYLAHNNIGWAYLKLGSYRQAEKHLQMSVFINPKFCNGHRNLAVLAEERGDATGALDHLEDAMKHCPKVADFYLQRGELLARAGKVLPAEEAFCTCLSIARKERLGKRCRGWVERLARQGGHGVCP
jgi:tetratricopeptide (TPR) repeat protein